MKVPIRRVITDNGKCFHSALFGACGLELGITFTRIYPPQTNGKAERSIQLALREWAYGRVYACQSSAERPCRLGLTSTTGTVSITASS